MKRSLRVQARPTEEELQESLQRAVEIYRPGFDESAVCDPVLNIGVLRQRLYGKNINVRDVIIVPGNMARNINPLKKGSNL